MLVGWISNLGLLYCVPCARLVALKAESISSAVSKNSQPHAFEKCDVCGSVVNNVEEGTNLSSQDILRRQKGKK